MPQQLGQVLERVNSVQLTGMNQTHEQIARVRSIQRLIEERIPAIQNRFLQSALDDVVVDGRTSLREEQRQLCPMIQ